MKIRLSSSKVSDIITCPRRALLAQTYEPTNLSSALAHGSVWHKILEVYYKTVKEQGWDALQAAIMASGSAAKKMWAEYHEKYNVWMDYRDFQTEMEMLVQYVNHYKDDQGFLEVIATEEKFELPIPLTEEEKKLGVEEIIYSGVIDLRCRLNGIPWLIDHKTTSMNPETEGNKLNRSLQFIGYAWAERELYGEAEGFMSNFASCISRKKKDGTYGVKNIRFARIPQLYSDEDFESFLKWVRHIARYVALCVEGEWPKNYASCYNYGRCRYWGVCEAVYGIPDGFREMPADEKGSPIVTVD